MASFMKLIDLRRTASLGSPAPPRNRIRLQRQFLYFTEPTTHRAPISHEISEVCTFSLNAVWYILYIFRSCPNYNDVNHSTVPCFTFEPVGLMDMTETNRLACRLIPHIHSKDTPKPSAGQLIEFTAVKYLSTLNNLSCMPTTRSAWEVLAD